jgi:hypothetical protein
MFLSALNSSDIVVSLKLIRDDHLKTDHTSLVALP